MRLLHPQTLKQKESLKSPVVAESWPICAHCRLGGCAAIAPAWQHASCQPSTLRGFPLRLLLKGRPCTDRSVAYGQVQLGVSRAALLEPCKCGVHGTHTQAATHTHLGMGTETLWARHQLYFPVLAGPTPRSTLQTRMPSSRTMPRRTPSCPSWASSGTLSRSRFPSEAPHYAS